MSNTKQTNPLRAYSPFNRSCSNETLQIVERNQCRWQRAWSSSSGVGTQALPVESGESQLTSESVTPYFLAQIAYVINVRVS